MDALRGVVERVTYANEETGYSVLKIKVKGYSELVPVVGNMTSISVGTVLLVQGHWKHNAKFGRQFEAREWEEKLPATIYGIEKYLGSGLIKGVGSVYAKKIVNQFKEATLDVLEASPDDLIKIEGIGPKRVAMIKQAWVEQKEVKNIMVFLQTYGVSTALGSRIYRAYGNESITVIQENPYKLADDIFGIGFQTADQLAQKLGIAQDSFVRCRSGVLYVLGQLANDGHCFAYPEQLTEKVVEILAIEEPKVNITIDHMIQSDEMINDSEVYYLPPFFHSEAGTARRLRKVTVAKRAASTSNQCVERISDGIVYDEIQQQAIELAQTAKVMVLTGGPGTGKTTTINGIIQMYQREQKKILLAAPTGRAAKRMSETTGLEAKTIHRLLEFKPTEGYKRNADRPLVADVVIIDEASMIDIVLMYNLLKAIPEEATVIIVGDVDQLPSVGPGNVLRDIIDSDTIPVVKLQRIFRQAQGSQIITNAHRINRGQFPELGGGHNSNFFFVDEKENIAQTIVELCSSRLPTYYRVDPVKDIQVLTPMRRTDTGAVNLNSVLQAALNRNTQYVERGAVQYRLGDKVMQIRNNYDKDVFNGDIGFISRIDLVEKTLRVTFDGREIPYEVLELDELVLAYATTIHKAQGSEYPVVVMPFSFSHYVMLQRNLLYTGITRAKRLVVLVGEKAAVATAVKNADVKQRNTLLAERLKG